MVKSSQLKYTYAKVFTPASVSNVGPGFDVLGFALQQLGDIIEVYATKKLGVKIRKITGDKGLLTTDAEKNTASVSAISFLKSINADFGIEMIINKKMPFASGLGSSAASAVGGVFAVNALLNEPLENCQLLPHALEGEKIASGSVMHADNVGPALYGGFVIARSIVPVDIIKIPFPEKLLCMVIYPQIEIKTEEARKILPSEVSRQIAVTQSSNAASLIAGILMKDYALISRSMIDSIAEPYRAKLIPMYSELKDFMLASGALNFNISGSGPSMFCFFDNKKKLYASVKRLKEYLTPANVRTDIFISVINSTGPEVLRLK